MSSEATWTYLRLCIEFPFVAFHASVSYVICRQMLKNHAFFNSGFFAIYLFQSVADISEYVSTVVFYRLPRVGGVPMPILDAMGTAGVFVCTYLLYFQFVSHTAIALNRYTMMAQITSAWKMKWKGTQLKVVLAVILLVPVPGSSIALIRRWKTAATAVPGVYAIVAEEDWVYAALNVSTALYSTLTSLVSFTLEVKTMFAYRRLSENVKRKHVEDYRLLIFAILQAMGQLCMTIRSLFVIVVVTLLNGNRDITSIIQLSHTFIIDILCLSTPICLMITSKHLRRKYFVHFCGYSGCEVASSTAVSNVSRSAVILN